MSCLRATPRTGSTSKRYVLVDLENAFGTAEWNYHEWSHRALPDPKDTFVLPKHLRDHLNTLGQDARAKAFGILGALNEADIRNFFTGYPEEWCGTAEREQAIEWTILRARLLGRWFQLNDRARPASTTSLTIRSAA